MDTIFSQMETDMQQTESKELRSSWLAENLEEMDRSVKQMRKLIEDGESLSKMHRPKLAAHVEDFYHMYQSLAERYDHLTGELQKNEQSYFQQQGSGYSKSGSGQGSPLLTPDHKLRLHKTSCQAASSTSGGSSDFSSKEVLELSSSSSSDSESESSNCSIKILSHPPISIAGKELQEKITEEENESYEELRRRVAKYEDKLRVSNSRLQLSEEEVSRLKSELHSQIESAKRENKMREDDLAAQRRQNLELQNNVSEFETHVSESNFEIEKLTQELEVSRERLKGSSDEEIKRLKNELANAISEGTNQLQVQLKLAQDDVAMLNAKLDSERMQVVMFQERIARYESNLSDRDGEIAELKVALGDAEEKFSLARAQLQSDMFSLLEKQAFSDARIKEWELQGKALEDKIIRQCETEKMEMKGLHEARENGMQSMINQLKIEVSQRGNHVEALTKSMDRLKLNYDMLMAEKDEVNAKVNTLMAEASSRVNQIWQMEELSRKLHIEHSESTMKLVDELRLRVTELEKEVDRQRMAISDGAEEKREAIRQLCFSLDHYRSGYQELRQAFLGNKSTALMAA